MTAKATAANPPLITRSINGGLGWAQRYAELPEHERQRIAIKLALGRELWWARKNGCPAPVIMVAPAESDPEGGYRLTGEPARKATDEELADWLR